MGLINIIKISTHRRQNNGRRHRHMEQRMRKMDSSEDRLATLTETQQQRIDILAKMASPDNLRRDHMQLAELLTNVKQLEKSCDRLYSMHNGKHPPVSDIRKAD